LRGKGRLFHDLDDYGNRIAAYVCSDLEADGSLLTDAECRDRSRVPFEPVDAGGRPSAAVHRYTRTEFDARGRYPVASFGLFRDPSQSTGGSEREISRVNSRNVFGHATDTRDVNGRRAYARFGALGRAYAAQVQSGASSVTTLRLCGAVSCPPEAVYRQQSTRSDGPSTWSFVSVRPPHLPM